MHVGGGDAEVVEEDVGEHGIVVLPGVHDHVVGARGGRRVGDGGQLHELGSCADDADDLHVQRF